ncbi:MAG: phage holin family protein [Bacteroidales bacterium]|nr:phage holin family protein [Bacteroidales bacterium]
MLDFFKNTDGEDRDAYKSIVKNAKEYGKLHLQLLKLNAVGSLSQIISYLIIIIVGALLLMGAFLYFSMILVVWMKQLTGSWIYGFLIMGSIFILLFVILLLLRKKIMVNPIIKKLSSILFKEEVESPDEEELPVVETADLSKIDTGKEENND